MPHCFESFDRRRRFPFIVVACAIVGLVPMISGGCVAMNIPSVRYDDPDDRGGPFGPQKKTDPETIAMHMDGGQSWDASGPASCVDCVDDDSWDGAGAEHSEKPPEVPWPRFHPLPTRPVFSSPQ